MFELHALPIDSVLLRGNRAGDPHRRSLYVLAPPGHDPSSPTPAIWVFPGYSGSQGGFLADDPWKESLPRRAGRLRDEGVLPDVLLVLPDLFTRYGGSQGLDSSATGPYEGHLWQELLPLLESRFSVSAHGAAGHSSGGYIALVQAMRHPDILRACACHAGDLAFDLCYRGDLPRFADRLRAEGGLEALLRAFEASPKKLDGRWLTPMNALAMAACYSPDPAEPMGIALPFDPETCELRPEVWERWLAWDPLRMVEDARHQEALRGLNLLFIDCGSRDEFALHWGARAFARRLRAAGIAHLHEEFDDGHTGTSYRFDRSLPLLARALGG